MIIGLCLHLQQGHAGIEFCLPGSPAPCWLPVAGPQLLCVSAEPRNKPSESQTGRGFYHPLCAGDAGM